MASNKPRFDVIVVGGGIAGLFAALCTAAEARVALVSGAAHMVHRRGLPPAFLPWL